MSARFRNALERREQGFTLIELLVVMIIIAVLAAIAIPLFMMQKKKAHETAAKSDATNIGKEMATFLVDGNPDAISAGSLPVTGPAQVTLTSTTAGVSDTAVVKVSIGDKLTKLTYTTATGRYCVEVTPVDASASPWVAAPDSVSAGTCP